MERSGDGPMPVAAASGVLAILEASFSPVLGRSVFHEDPEPAPVVPEVPEPVPEPPPKAASGRKAAAAASAKGKKKEKAEVPVEVVVEPDPKPAPPPDEYDVRIQEIQATCEAEVTHQQQMKRYLVEQHDSAAASFARELAAKDEQYTRFWQYTGLPMKPSHLRLDTTKLEGEGLLDPGTIMGQMQQERSKEVLHPPAVFEYSDTSAAPHHLETTAASASRAHMRQDLLERSKRMAAESTFLKWNRLPEEEVKQLMKASKHRRHLNGMRMGGDQWDLEAKIIASMQHKLAFKRNARFDYMAPTPKKGVGDSHLARPKFGIGVTPSGAPKSKAYSTAKAGVCFVCEPEEVVISRYEAGYVYEMEVQIRNVSSTLRRIRIVPPQSQYFFVSQLAYPGPEGLVAPGMHATALLRFTPDSLADFSDAFTVDTELSRITVPLRAALTVPTLSLQHDTPVGTVYVGRTLTCTVPVHALTGSGTFRIVAADAWPQALSEVPASAVQIGPELTVSPPIFRAAPGLSASLTVTFAPSTAGPVSRAYALVCDNCHVQHLTLSALGVAPVVSLSHLDGAALRSGQLDTALLLADAVPGSTTVRTVGITNSGPLELPFCWRHAPCGGASQASPADAVSPAATSNIATDSNSTGENEAAMAGSSASEQMRETHADGAIFAVSPAQGVLMPGETLHCELSFAPAAVADYARELSVYLNAAWPPGTGDADVLGLVVAVQGRGAPHPACVVPTRLRVPGVLRLGQTAVQQVVITNPSRAPASFQLTGGSEAVYAEPSEGSVPPGATLGIAVHAHALAARPFSATLLCSIDHGATVPLTVSAPDVATPALTIAATSLQMGLLQWRRRGVQTLTLTNPSTHASAAWTLHEDASAVHRRLAAAGAGGTRTRVVFPRSRGVLAPGEGVDVEVHCVAETEGSYRSAVCVASGSQVTRVPVLAEVVQPRVLLTGGSQSTDLTVAYVGVPVQRTVTLSNATQLRTAWEWPGKLYGDSAARARVAITPERGELAGGASVTLAVDVAPLAAGALDCLTAFTVSGQSDAVPMQVLADIRPLAVSYTVRTPAQLAERDAQRSAGGEPCTSAPGSGGALEGCAEGGDPVTGPQMLCFGEQIPLGEVQTRVLCVHNPTGIETSVRLWVDHFVSGGGQAMTDGVQSIRRLSASAGRQGAVVLSQTHERSHPFAAAAGNDMIAMRSVQDTVKRLLGDKGLALSLTPDAAVLPPFSEARFQVQCVNNMVGEYLDTLHLAVGDLPVRDVVVRAGVVGTPVHVQQASHFIPGLQHELSRRMSLAFGAVPCNVTASKQFNVFNTCCFDMEVDLRVVTYEADPGKPWVGVGVEIDADGNVALQCQPVTTSAEACYTVEPTHLKLGKGGSSRVRVTFCSAQAHQHEACVEGIQRLSAPASVVQLKTYTPPDKATAPGPDGNGLRVFLQGSFHPHAAPPTLPVLPLIVQLSADCTSARLEPDQVSELSWSVHSIHAPKTHASFVHTITLSNLLKTPLALTLSTRGPFHLLSAEASVPQEAERFMGATFFDAAAFKAATATAGRPPLFLPPQESLDVTIMLRPPPGSALVDYRLQGDLIAHYLNGEEQILPLRAEVLHPELQCSFMTGEGVTVVDFGAVHTRAPKWIDVTLTNATDVDAIWQVHHSNAAPPAITLAATQDPSPATISAFQLTPGQGMLRGQGLTVPRTQTVRLMFSPPDNRPHEAHVTFHVLGGQPCAVVLRGQGTFDETCEFKAELQGL